MRTSKDSRGGASGGAVGSTEDECGVRTATLPSWIESKLNYRSSHRQLSVQSGDLSLDQDDLIGGLTTKVLPFVIRVVANIERLAVTVRIPHSSGNEVILRIHAAVVAEGEGIVQGWVVDGTP